MIRLLLFLGSVLFPLLVVAQDPQFSQFHANPLYQNPAFTGSGKMGRLIVNYRKQWFSLNRDFETAAASYDTYLRDPDSRNGQPALGLGFQVYRDKQGGGSLIGADEGLFTTGAYFSGSKRLAQAGTDGKFKLWGGMQAGIISRLIRGQGLLFADQFSGSGISPSSMDPLALANGINRNFFDVNAGLLLESDPQEGLEMYDRDRPMYQIGASLYHLNKSLQRDPWLPVSQRFNLHAGVTIPFALVEALERNGSRTPYRVRTHTLTANYRSQEKTAQLDVGYNWRYTPLMLGVWMRGIPLTGTARMLQRESLAFLIGWQPSDMPFQLQISYDVPLSSFRGSTGGAYELSLWMGLETLRLPGKFKGKRQFRCPL